MPISLLVLPVYPVLAVVPEDPPAAPTTCLIAARGGRPGSGGALPSVVLFLLEAFAATRRQAAIRGALEDAR